MSIHFSLAESLLDLITELKNHDRPEKYKKKFSDFSATLFDLAKVTAILSTFLGTITVIIFCFQTKTPLPPIDTSFGLTITIFMAAFSIFIYSLICLFFAPSLFSIARSSRLIKIFPSLLSPASSLKRRIIAYITCYSPFLFSWAILVFTGFFDFFSDLSAAIFVASVTIVVASILSSIAVFKKAEEIFLQTIKDGGYYFMCLLAMNIASFMWSVLFFISYRIMIYAAINYTALPYPSFLAILIMLFSHLSQCTSKQNLQLKTLLLVIYIFVAMTIAPGSTQITASILQTIGAGGSLPAEIVFKPKKINGNNDADPNIEKVCIMFSTASHVVVKREDNNQPKGIPTCQIFSETAQEDKKLSRKSYKISIYNRSDILEISLDR